MDEAWHAAAQRLTAGLQSFWELMPDQQKQLSEDMTAVSVPLKSHARSVHSPEAAEALATLADALAGVQPSAEQLAALQRGNGCAESGAEVETLSKHAGRSLAVARACTLLLQLGPVTAPELYGGPLASRLLAGMTPFLTVLPAATAATAAAACRTYAQQPAAGSSTATDTGAAVEQTARLDYDAIRLLQTGTMFQLLVSQLVYCLDRQAAGFAAADQLAVSTSQLLTSDAVGSFCSGMQQALDSLAQLQPLADAADSAQWEPSAGGAEGAEGGESTSAGQKGPTIAQHLDRLLQQYAGCLFSMAQLVPPGGPAWQHVDSALSWQGLAAALPDLLIGAQEGLTSLMSFGTDFAVSCTPTGHAGCVLLAAAALEGRLIQLLACVHAAAAAQPQQQPSPSALQQPAAVAVWQDAQLAGSVALALGSRGTMFSITGQLPQPLPQTRVPQLRVLSAGAALLSLAADASSGSGSSGQAAASWEALAASAGSEEAAEAAVGWGQLLLELRPALSRGDGQLSLPCNQLLLTVDRLARLAAKACHAGTAPAGPLASCQRVLAPASDSSFRLAMPGRLIARAQQLVQLLPIEGAADGSNLPAVAAEMDPAVLSSAAQSCSRAAHALVQQLAQLPAAAGSASPAWASPACVASRLASTVACLASWTQRLLQRPGLLDAQRRQLEAAAVCLASGCHALTELWLSWGGGAAAGQPPQQPRAGDQDMFITALLAATQHLTSCPAAHLVEAVVPQLVETALQLVSAHLPPASDAATAEWCAAFFKAGIRPGPFHHLCYLACHRPRVALRCVASGLAARSMQLLALHAELREAAGQPLPPTVWRTHIDNSVHLLAFSLVRLKEEMDVAADPHATGGTAVPNAASGRAALRAATQQVMAAAGALWRACKSAERQGFSCRLSDWKALVAGELPQFEAAVKAWHSLVAPQPEVAASAERSPWPALAEPPTSEQQLAVAAALVARPGCANLRCANCSGAEEQGMPRGRRCSGCLTVRFCLAACQREAWPQHRVACRLLAAARVPSG